MKKGPVRQRNIFRERCSDFPNNTYGGLTWEWPMNLPDSQTKQCNRSAAAWLWPKGDGEKFPQWTSTITPGLSVGQAGTPHRGGIGNRSSIAALAARRGNSRYGCANL